MLGLKLRSPLGRAAGVWSLSAAALALSACSTSGEHPGTGGGGSGSGGSSTTGGAGGMTVTPPGTAPQAGVTTLRRLNRTEYGNTLRDLTGTTTDYGAKFP